MTIIVNFDNDKDLDMAIIPDVIYEYTIDKKKEAIEDYFIKHLNLLFSFVGFNSALKLANQLASNKKCGCFYKLPWITHYQAVNNKKIVLSFSQQVEEYRYMLINWYQSGNISYMQYLSQIALNMILDIRQFFYYRDNNLYTCNIFTRYYYKNNFKNEKVFIVYLRQINYLLRI